jgi:hypothetical protein
MEHSMVNIDNGLSTISEHQDAPIGESHALWNDPSRNRNPSSTGVVENFNHWRTHYPLERRRDNLFNRILRKIGIRFQR